MNRPAIGGLAAVCVAFLALAGVARAQQGLTVPAPAATAKPKIDPILLSGSCHEPEYPLTSIRSKQSGRALVRLYVDERGGVTDTHVVASSGFYLLDQETSNAFWSCRFLPARDASGAAIKSIYVKAYEWKLEKAPPDPWTLLSLVDGQGFAAVSDFDAIPFSGESVASPAQRVKMLRATSAEAAEKARCPNIEQVSARIVRGGEKVERRSLELWTLKQCGQDMRYVVAIFSPTEDRPASFRMMPLAVSQPSP